MYVIGAWALRASQGILMHTHQARLACKRRNTIACEKLIGLMFEKFGFRGRGCLTKYSCARLVTFGLARLGGLVEVFSSVKHHQESIAVAICHYSDNLAKVAQ